MQKNYLRYLSLVPMIFLTTIAYCQQIITGAVTDNSKGIPGVNVKVKGKKIFTQTNHDGKYNISVAEGDILQFSFLGYLSVEKAVGKQNMVDVVLKEGNTTLKEVNVSIRYGSQKKHEASSSLATAKGEQLQNQPSTSIEGLLQGLVPGLVVQNNSGMPGGRSNVTLRGVAAFSNSANSNVVSTPLFIIDGVSLEQDVFNPSDPQSSHY